MGIDFTQATYRHMRDAEYLETNQRIPNAAQLYGFAAECGLKATLLWKGYQKEIDGSPKRLKDQEIKEGYELRNHIDKLSTIINQIQQNASGRSAAKYLAMIPSINNFNSWRVEHRYCEDDYDLIFQKINDWKASTQEVMRMVDHAKSEGMS